MKINFCGIDEKYLWGINELKDRLGIELCDDGVRVSVQKCGEGINSLSLPVASQRNRWSYVRYKQL